LIRNISIKVCLLCLSQQHTTQLFPVISSSLQPGCKQVLPKEGNFSIKYRDYLPPQNFNLLFLSLSVSQSNNNTPSSGGYRSSEKPQKYTNARMPILLFVKNPPIRCIGSFPKTLVYACKNFHVVEFYVCMLNNTASAERQSKKKIDENNVCDDVHVHTGAMKSYY